MRRLFSIFIIIALSINFFGFYIVFLVNREDIRMEMDQLIRTAKMPEKHFSFSKAEYAQIAWEKQDKEFRYKGKLYDVSRIEKIYEKVRIYVEEDLNETELVADFISNICGEQDKSSSNSPLNNLLSHFLQEFTLGQMAYVSVPVVSILSFSECTFQFTSFIGDLLSPPPDLLFA